MNKTLKYTVSHPQIKAGAKSSFTITNISRFELYNRTLLLFTEWAGCEIPLAKIGLVTEAEFAEEKG